MIKYSFIIPVKEINDYVRESVPKILEIAREDYEVIIYPDFGCETKESWSKTRQIPSPPGPAVKRSLAIRDAMGEFLVFVDDDAYPEKSILDFLDEDFKNLEVTAVGGPAVTPKSDSFLQKVSGAIYLSVFSERFGYNEKVMKKYFLVLVLFLLTIGSSVQAVCPVCTVAVGAGVGFSRYLGIDDTIAGLWIGALIVSMAMWTINWLNKKNIRFKGREILITFLYYAITIWPLFYWEIGGTTIMGHPYNKIWGFDKLLVGIVIGSVAFFLSSIWYDYLKRKNDGHAHFPYQKVVMPVVSLIILSAIFYFINRN